MKLKNLLLTAAVLTGINTGMKAQNIQADSAEQTATILEQTPQEEQATVTLDKLYAGMYGIMNIDDEAIENGNPQSYTSLRVGGGAKWNLSDKLSVWSTLGFDKSGGEEKNEFIINNYGVAYDLSETTKLDAGKIPHAATHMLASPFTAGGHFLFTPETKVPLTALGGKITQKFGKNTVAASVAQRDGFVEPSVFVSNDHEKRGSLYGAVAYNTTTEQFEGGAGWSTDFSNRSNIYSVVWVDAETLSAGTQWTSKQGPKAFDKVGIFFDTEYSLGNNKLNHFQTGIIKDFPMEGKFGTTDIKIGAAYEAVKGVVQTVLFINLNK